ncbi:hypothetical protein NDU88_002282 [Pleurodeles waltl]|uniref:Uncharacterized protein n=1 Tax=Pleurodeles waltl TaxID=8319 RepID=A0AAV7MP64_PLEWA|nr:hypothetical protein NDU88_002282 [Pleurodeles waltl]
MATLLLKRGGSLACSPGPVVLVSAVGLHGPGSQLRFALQKSSVSVFWVCFFLRPSFSSSCRLPQTPAPDPVFLPVKGGKPPFDHPKFPRRRQVTNGKGFFPGRFRVARGSDSTSQTGVRVGLVRPVTNRY